MFFNTVRYSPSLLVSRSFLYTCAQRFWCFFFIRPFLTSVPPRSLQGRDVPPQLRSLRSLQPGTPVNTPSAPLRSSDDRELVGTKRWSSAPQGSNKEMRREPTSLPVSSVRPTYQQGQRPSAAPAPELDCCTGLNGCTLP